MYLIDYYYTSHIGKCRKNNQDNLFCDGEYLECNNSGIDGIKRGTTTNKKTSLFAVFDGMGGEEKGEMAAFLATQTLSNCVFENETKSDYLKFCKNANDLICQYVDDNNLTSMGTTAAILRFDKRQISLCNIGDSKIFKISEQDIQQISFDHVGVCTFGKKPPLSQNLGIPESELILSPYIATGNYEDNDIYLISSDGLTDMVSSDEIKKILQCEDRQLAVEQLLEAALNNGGKDNITIILIQLKKYKNNIFNKLKKKAGGVKL